MESYEFTDLDVFMVHAAEVETKIYGTLRMVREDTTFQSQSDAQNYLRQSRGLLSDGDFEHGPVSVSEYFFESLNPDFDEDKFAIWDMIADDQSALKKIFEMFEREGVGSNPEPPTGSLHQSMAWFYPSGAVIQKMSEPDFVQLGIDFLRTNRATTDFEESQRVAALVTFAKHRCIHVWSGESEDWSCDLCGEPSFLPDQPR
jgi:hypothetical protein